jgi:hypothetical protein
LHGSTSESGNSVGIGDHRSAKWVDASARSLNRRFYCRRCSGIRYDRLWHPNSGGRHADHRAFHSGLGRNRAGSVSGRLSWRGSDSSSSRFLRVRLRIHHQHGALELGRLRAFDLETATLTSAGFVRILRTTIGTKHRNSSSRLFRAAQKAYVAQRSHSSQ